MPNIADLYEAKRRDWERAVSAFNWSISGSYDVRRRARKAFRIAWFASTDADYESRLAFALAAARDAVNPAGSTPTGSLNGGSKGKPG